MFSKSLFKSKTFWAMLSPALAAWMGYLQGSVDLQAAISATVMALLGMGMRLMTNGPAHLVTPVQASQAAPGAPVTKTQAGFARFGLLGVLAVAAMLVSLVGCVGQATVNTPNNAQESVAGIQVVVATGVNTADTLLLAHKISKAEAQAVLNAAKTITGVLNQVSAYLAVKDTASANAALAGTVCTAALETVTDFIAAHPASAQK